MPQTSNFVFNEDVPAITGPSADATVAKSDSTLDKVITTAGDVGGVFSELDKVLHPSKYQTPAPQQGAPQQYQKQSGFGSGWVSKLFLAAAAGTAIYGVKQFYDDHKKSNR